MKKFAFALCALMETATAFAGVASVEGYSDTASFKQFTHNEATNTGNYVDGRHPDQNWLGAQTISLSIDSACDVWLSNYVSSWYWPKPLDALDGNVFDMGATKYGAIALDGSQTWVGTGETTMVTFVDDATGVTNSTEAYFVGHFEGGEEVSIWMTTLPEDGGETVDMQQYVADADHPTTLASRVDGTKDLAGNVRMNFGLTNMIGREFIAFGVGGTAPAPSGQPLPGIAIAGALALGTIAAAKKMRKRS